VPFSCSRWASRGSANHTSVDSRIVGAPETGFWDGRRRVPSTDKRSTLYGECHTMLEMKVVTCTRLAAGVEIAR
jgi:hypothetical protein